MTIEEGAEPAMDLPVADLGRQRARRQEAMREATRRREVDEFVRIFHERVANTICVPEEPRRVTFRIYPPGNDC